MTVSRLYIDSSRVSEEVKEHLCIEREGGVVISEYGDVWEDVRILISKTEGKIWVSVSLCSTSPTLHVPLQVSSTSSYRMVSQVPQGRWLAPLSPLQMLKAVKNETEAKGMRAAHVSSSS